VPKRKRAGKEIDSKEIRAAKPRMDFSVRDERRKMIMR
jgi:hypothetical protein